MKGNLRKGRFRKFVMAFLAALLIVPGGLAAPAAADPNVPETVTVFHESFAGGQGVAVQSGSPSIMHVTGKVFDGNADGHALYLSGRTNTWDALDYEFEKIGLFDGKTYTVTVIGYVDADETVPAGAKAYLQTANSYGLWGEADFEPGKAFALTGTVTADYSKDDRLRIQSNGYGESVSFYIGEVIITTDNPIYEESFDKSDFSETKLVQSGNPKLELVQGVVFDGNPDGHALSVTDRVYDYDGVDIPFSAFYLKDGYEYSVTIAVYVDANVTVGPDAVIAMQTVDDYKGWASAPLEAGKAVNLTQTFTVDTNSARAIRIQTSNAGQVPFYIGSITIRQLTAGGPEDPFEPVEIAKYDFDDGTTQGWTGRGDGTAAASTDKSHSGTHSLKITNRSQNWHGAEINIADLILPGAEYQFKAYARLVDGQPGANIHLTVQVGEGAGATYTWVTKDTPVTDGDWVELSPGDENFKLSEPNAVVKLYAESSEGDNDPKVEFYIDDVTITQVTPAPPQQDELFTQTYDFEDGVQGWRARGDDTSVETTKEDKYDGLQSLKVTKRSETWHGAELDALRLLHPGATYEISAYVKLAHAPENPDNPGEFKITAQRLFEGEENPDWYTIAASTAVDNTNWTLLKGSYTLTKPAQSILLYIESSNASDEYYIDNVVIKLTNAPKTVFDFESGQGDWVRRFGGDSDPNISVTNEDNHTPDGSYSLKTTVTQQYDGPLFDLRGKVYRGHQYEFTVWVKMAQGQDATIIRMTVQNDSSSFVNVTSDARVTDQEWVKLTGRYTQSAPPGDDLNVYVEVADPITQARTFLIDDFEMKYIRPVPGPNPDFSLPSIKDVYEDYFPVGSIMNPVDFNDEHRTNMLKKHFALLTAENAMKPDYAYDAARNFDFADEDALVQKAIDEGFLIHGHVLVWHSQSPSWLHSNPDGSPLDRDTALHNLRTHVKTVVEHFGQTFGDNIISWDVVNEAVDDGKLANPEDWESTLRESGWFKAIGPDFIYEAFKAAREVIDQNGWKTELYYNDYNDDNQSKMTAITNMVKALNERYARETNNPNKKLIDGIGMQAHYTINTNPENVRASIEKIIGIGVKVGITELDIGAGNGGTITQEQAIKQGQLYAQLFQLYKEYADHITRVTFWGLDDASSWRSEGSPLLFDARLQAKPAYYAVIDPEGFLAEYPPEQKEYRQGKAAYGTPVIDDEEDAVWNRAEKLPIDRYLSGNGATGWAKALWDDEHLYVLVKVEDPVLDDSSPNPYEQDSVEVFVDETNSKAASYGPGIGQYRVNFNNVATFNPADVAPGFESRTVVNATYTGYTVEMKIPFRIITPQNGTKIGFDAQINDGENGSRHTLVKWNDTTDQGWQDPSVFGVLTLIGKPGAPGPVTPPASRERNEDGSVTVKPPVTILDGRAKASVRSGDLKAALEMAEADDAGRKTVILEIGATNAEAFEVELPRAGLSADESYVISLKTPLGTIDIPSNMLDGIAEGAETVTIAIAKVSPEALDDAVRSRIGNRPAISLHVRADGEIIAWNNPAAPVTVAIPYKPTEEESARTDHLVVLYIDGEGRAAAVPSGRYDAELGSVVFRTTHFSTYAVAWVVKTFDDLAGVPWAKGAIEALASRGVIAGVSETSFNPSANIKRADFIALLVRALELEDSGEAVTMFDDVKETDYFYREVKVAKQLGIASGVGGNRFDPNGSITRQDMMVLADRALAAAGKALPAGDGLDRFPDAGDAAAYARASAGKLVAAGIVSGMDGKLAPREHLTRAQAAVILYQLWKR